MKTFPIPSVLQQPNQITASVAFGVNDATTTVIEPYRTPPPTHQALDLACRRCGKHPLIYAYFPYVLPVPGPQCKACFIEWSGISGVDKATVGVGFFAYPLPMRGGSLQEWTKYVVPARKDIKIITVPGVYPDISPWIE